MEYLRPGSDSVVECPVCHSQEFYEGETEYKLRCSDCSFIMEFEFPPYAKPCMGTDFDLVDCFNSKPYDPFKISCNRCGFIMDFAGGVAPYAEVGVLGTANQAK